MSFRRSLELFSKPIRRSGCHPLPGMVYFWCVSAFGSSLDKGNLPAKACANRPQSSARGPLGRICRAGRRLPRGAERRASQLLGLWSDSSSQHDPGRFGDQPKAQGQQQGPGHADHDRVAH